MSDMNRFKRMLCVIDPTKVYLPALERAIALAQRNQATVAVVAVIDPATVGSDATEYSAPRIHLEKGRAQRKIPVLAKRIGIDLVVMGTVIRTGTPGFIIGNTAETILNQIDSSVLALKPPGFVTPVSI